MSLSNQKKVFLLGIVAFIVLMSIAGLGDLQVSNTLINYNSVFGTVFQSFGEFTIYFLLIVPGQIAINYALRVRDNKLFSVFLLLGGLGLSGWQLREYQKEVESYTLSIMHNISQGKPMGLANSDASTVSLNLGTSYLIWVILLVFVTFLAQFLLNRKDDEQVRKLLIVSVFVALTVWFSLEVNTIMKATWGRFRPYELNKLQTNYTPWYHINGVNGHKSFPSGHTMAGTLAIVYSWFFGAKTNMHKRLWLTGIIYGALMGLSRVIIGAHFLGDVSFSFFITSVIIFVMWEVYQRVLDKKDIL